MVLHFRHRKHLIKSKSSKLAIVVMFMSVAFSLIDTIWSIYLDEIIHNPAMVGIITGLLALLGGLFMIFSTPILERFAETRLWMLTMWISIAGFISFYFVNSLTMFLVIAVVVTLAGVIRMQAHGILVRDSTKASEIGKTEGLQYTLNNIGWMLGPLLAGFIASRIGVRPVFLFAAIFFVIAFMLFKQIHFRNINRFTEDDGTLKSSLKNLFTYFKNKERAKNYFLSGGVNLYWGIIYVFMPLFMLQQGIPAYWIGIFLFSVAVPLVLVEYKVGMLADIQGYKKFFVIGYTVLFAGSLLAFFNSNAYAWMGILFVTSFGAGFLESTTESYFFKTVKRKEEEKYYGPYNTSVYAVSSMGKLIAGGVLFFLANQFVFLALAIEMFILLFIALSLNEKRVRH